MATVPGEIAYPLGINLREGIFIQLPAFTGLSEGHHRLPSIGSHSTSVKLVGAQGPPSGVIVTSSAGRMGSSAGCWTLRMSSPLGRAAVSWFLAILRGIPGAV
ncbi:uncharacterized protein An12g04320 [Aspergillus niger]|uniref:Contig An12c0120, genomic contig n=2 Tax=Aspergillus niger TaxID=5061 RepID=A2QZB4_ASPNC|nr:uncharacterized protein An12g04320 [Aspergillus niger]CAK46199.1 unnamed protein product [Aspergillus niger]